MKLEVHVQDRKSSVLTPSQLPCLRAVPSVNLTSGCAHGCVYCYARSYSQCPGEGNVIVYGNTAAKLRCELQRKRRKPSHVYFSPSTDVFQPVPRVLDMAYEMFQVLFAAGVGVAFVTKGRIPERHMELIAENAKQVRVQVGLVTTDPEVAQAIEPNAATPGLRLRQMDHLVQAGVRTRVRVAPILPGLTDDDATLADVFGAAAAAGVTQAALNALHLRPAIVASLRGHLPSQWADAILARYRGAASLAVCGGKSSQTPLPAQERLQLFARARAIASQYGIETHVCGCMNPDLTNETCGLAGDWPDDSPRVEQLRLW